MPARPIRLDEIGEKMKGAVIREIVEPVCCFLDDRGHSCKQTVVALLTLRFNDGRVDQFALCQKDLTVVKEQHPSTLERHLKQALFFY